ncbi:polyhydroxyalkanoate synthesis regulator [Candidatus Acetothermia bacterium]|nr:MAG: polyhydroxyalkanoate synthesis regulator [Candidatus Acetothermia bacterium]
MFEHSRKAILLGLGALELTREKVESFVDELVKRGEASAKEKAGLVDELLKAAEEEEKKAMEKISSALREVISELGLATKDDLQAIERRLERIERRLAGEETDASE